MSARHVLVAAVTGCALVAGPVAGPAASTAAPQPSRDPATRASTPQPGEDRPRHTSDGEPGRIAEPRPAGYRPRATTADRVSWQVSPGVTYTRWDQRDDRGPVRAHLLSIDPSQPGLRLDYARTGPIQQTAPMLDILRRDGAIAGVNGDFFDIGDTGAPLGLGQDRQRGLLHARDRGWNSAFYVDASGRPQIGTLPMVATIEEHPGLAVANLNSPFVKPGRIGVYTRAWGRTAGYRVTDGQRRKVRMVAIRGGVVRATRTRLSRDRRIRGLLLVGRGEGARQLRRLRVGAPATVGWRLGGRPRMAISGNRFLVDDGVTAVVDDRELHPRTAVGVDEDTGEVLLLAVDGRQSFSRGYTMVELAELMIDLGADEALNLDGGGSTTMVARRPSGRVRVVNSPSDGHQRPVANGLQVTYARPR